MIAKVEPLTPARALRGPFDYRLPGEMSGVDVGSMLLIPFGQRRLLGVVVELATESDVPPDRLVEPLKALESGVPPELVRLGLWVAEEYCSTPARGLSLVLPPGTGTGASRSSGPRRALFAGLTDAGRAAASDPEGAADGARLGGRQRAALAALLGGPLSVAGLTRATGAGHATVRALEARGLVSIERGELRSRPDIAGVGARSGSQVDLTAAQAEALAGVIERMDAEDRTADRRLLLHGVTGSGKTEVYLQAVAAALDRGRSAIVLVPEIALTPQTAARFEQRFGDAVAVLHSKLGAAERRDEWLRLRRGEARVCVGPRSAVFAPVSDLGLIVIDEEHDASYKQEGDPRYDARQVAERRAAQAGAVLLAGTATPRPESWARLARLSMPARVDGRAMPPVEIVGTAGMTGPLHERTRSALERRARPGREGDRPAQPARVVELPVLPLVRPGVGVPAVRRDARTAPGRRPRVVPPLRAQRARARHPARTAGRCRWPATGPAPSASSRIWPSSSTRSRSSGSTPTPPRAAGRYSTCCGASTRRPRACSSARRWWPRGTTSPTSRSASSWTPTRRCGSPTSGPRSALSRWSRSSPGAPGGATVAAG